jgi:hypothetical protein
LHRGDSNSLGHMAFRQVAPDRIAQIDH